MPVKRLLGFPTPVSFRIVVTHNLELYEMVDCSISIIQQNLCSSIMELLAWCQSLVFVGEMQVSYNIMINVYATAGLHHEAQELFQAMLRDGCSPDSLTYLALIRAYTQSFKFLEAEETIMSMQNEGVLPSCVHFNQLLSAFAKAGFTEEAERVYHTLLSAGLSPDVACYRTMLRGYLDYGCVEKGITFFEQIRESVEPDRFIMSSAVHFYKLAGKELEAEGILDSMKSLGIPFLKNLEVGSKTKAP